MVLGWKLVEHEIRIARLGSGAAVLAAALGVAACGGDPTGPAAFPAADGAALVPGEDAGSSPRDAHADEDDETPVQVTAQVTGLVGKGLVLRTETGEELRVSADGKLAFSQPLVGLDPDSIEIVSQPVDPTQYCTAEVDGEGSVSVVCGDPTYAVGGTVSGLLGSGLVLESASGEKLPVAADGVFRFATRLADRAAYAVHVATMPTGPSQTCALTGGEGTVAGIDVSDVQVVCTTNRYRVLGNVSGLLGSGLTLQVGGLGSLAISGNGEFAFSGSLPDATRFVVEVSAQPHAPDQRCVVVDGDSALAGGDAHVQVLCGAAGGLRISEVGSCYWSDSACWIELYNAGTALEELSYYTLRSSSASRSPPYLPSESTFALPQGTLAPGRHVVVQAASSSALPDGLGVVHVARGEQVPWWNASGFVELASAGRSVDFVRFGDSQATPSTSGWTGGSVGALPTGEQGYGYSIARNAAAFDSDRASDWAPRAFATPGGPNDVISDADVDRDGVPDSAEVAGGRFAGLDLYAMGARIGPRDVFIEIDRMQSSDPAVIPQREALDKVRAALLTHNVALHFDVGSLYAASFDPASYNLGGGDVVPFAKGVTIGDEPRLADIYDYKAEHMEAPRRSLFYYMLFAWSQEVDGSGGSSGIGERPGNDSIITLGGWGLDTGSAQRKSLLVNYQAATMMHELGHNLSLRHGGNDDVNYKPNYVSVMNYMYSPVGLSTIGQNEGDRYYMFRLCRSLVWRLSDLTNPPTGDSSRFVLDFSSGLSAPLDETAVREASGLGRSNSQSVDYDCDGKLDSELYSRDLNVDGQQTILYDHDDWSSLDLVFRRSYSGNENGPYSWYSDPSAMRDDLLTDDVQTVNEEPCPAPALPL